MGTYYNAFSLTGGFDMQSRFTMGDGFIIALALILIFALALGSGGQGRRRLEIRTPEGKWQYALPAADRVIPLAGSAGPFVVAISAHTVTITETHCPDTSCARMGPIEKPGQIMICLPQQIELVILSRDEDPDVDSVCY
jgi:hypothetical protein